MATKIESILEEVRNNNGLLVLTALLSTELDIVSDYARYGGETGEKPRIAWWTMCLKEESKPYHCGDCIGVPARCNLCLLLNDIEHSISVIEVAKQKFPNIKRIEDLVRQSIAIILFTQPSKELESNVTTSVKQMEESSLNEEGQWIFPWGIEIEERFDTADFEQITNLIPHVDALLAWTTKLLSIDLQNLKQWWKTGDQSIISF